MWQFHIVAICGVGVYSEGAVGSSPGELLFWGKRRTEGQLDNWERPSSSYHQLVPKLEILDLAWLGRTREAKHGGLISLGSDQFARQNNRASEATEPVEKIFQWIKGSLDSKKRLWTASLPPVATPVADSRGKQVWAALMYTMSTVGSSNFTETSWWQLTEQQTE